MPFAFKLKREMGERGWRRKREWGGKKEKGRFAGLVRENLVWSQRMELSAGQSR